MSLVCHRHPAKEEADRGEQVHLHGNGSPSSSPSDGLTLQDDHRPGTVQHGTASHSWDRWKRCGAGSVGGPQTSTTPLQHCGTTSCHIISVLPCKAAMQPCGRPTSHLRAAPSIPAFLPDSVPRLSSVSLRPAPSRAADFRLQTCGRRPHRRPCTRARARTRVQRQPSRLRTGTSFPSRKTKLYPPSPETRCSC